MTGPKFVGIVLAAGFSSRMGDLKPLMPLGRTTIVAHVVSTFHEAGVADPRVVVGHRRDEVREHLKPAGVTVIENPDYRRGMFSSVQAGVGALPEDTGAFFILPVDVPLVRPWTIRSLGRAMAADPVPVVYPVFNGRRGHPPLIGRELAAEIRESSPDIS
ncbi:MAG: nucleotidyltransferase family protein, partial [Proteobacteria bacterium]|nr:nucleotidyltransferase family protein [Pseudomonadota bacterium]